MKNLPITLLALGLCASQAAAQTPLVAGGKAVSRIALRDDSPENLRAAEIINIFARRISGDSLPVHVGKARKGDIRIGDTMASVPRTDTTDGFCLTNKDGVLRILTGGGRGAVYGAVTLVDDYMGVEYWTDSVYDLTQSPDITIPRVERTEIPTFRFRQTPTYGNNDPMYKDWFRLREPREVFVDNLWVHTSNKLLPATKYGQQHPEWYAVMPDGSRMLGSHSQWCMTNPGLLEAATAALDSVFRANPGLRTISVSQNDRGDNFCHCPKCTAINEAEGSEAGTVIRFVNELARRFPDKEISTLAYQFSRRPPKLTKPEKNVNIMLCNIECTRELPLTQTQSGREFVDELEGWSAISDNLYIWDYGINFDNLVTPFPNFRNLAPNIRLFRDNHATMLHEQVNGCRGVDLSEMRAYVLARLMWNADADADSLMCHFAQGYYGDAAPYILEYDSLRTAQLLSSGKPLQIYDTPLSHKEGMLSPENMAHYAALFDKAEQAVKQQPDKTERVLLARVPLMYCELELARAKADTTDAASRRARLERFDSVCTALGVEMLDEKNFKPATYVHAYRDRYLPRPNRNLARGAKFLWGNEPAQQYLTTEQTELALLDGIYGGFTFRDGWAGWVGRDPLFTLDLGQPTVFSSVEADFLHHPGAWILLPSSGVVSVSDDGQSFREIGTFSFAEDREPAVKFVKGVVTLPEPVTARYIRLDIANPGPLPVWHIGAGSPSCVFIDEVQVLE